MQVFTDTNFQFISKRKIAYIVSLTLIGLGILSLLIHLGPNFSIDFEGGTLLDLRIYHSSETKVSVGEIRDALARIDMANAEIQIAEPEQRKSLPEGDKYDTYTNMMIKVKGHQKPDAEKDPLAEKIKDTIRQQYTNANLEVLRQEEVGPKIGEELKWKALLAIFWAMVGIILYIWWRFEFKFGIAAIIALFHDVLITVGIFSILNLEISLAIVAALLTIVGYSLNDTIVVFDRIRENLRLLRRQSYSDIINASINQSLSRTVITSATTLLVVLALLILGGGVIRPFAFALLIGVLVGTYSSIFVASPILVEWQLYKEAKEKQSRRARRKGRR
jgi:preprotein translocase SecF subunit